MLEKSFGECKKFLLSFALMLYLLIYRTMFSFLMVLKFDRLREKIDNYNSVNVVNILTSSNYIT